MKGSDLVEIPKEPNEVLRHPKDPYRRNRVLRLNGPDGSSASIYSFRNWTGPGAPA